MIRIKSVGVVLAAVVSLAAVSPAWSAEFFIDLGNAKAGNTATALVGFAGDSAITDAQIDVAYDAATVKVSVKALGAAGCSNPKAGLIRVVSPDLGGQVLGSKVGAYCQITARSIAGKSFGAGGPPLVLQNAFCSGEGGTEISCGAENAAQQ